MKTNSGFERVIQYGNDKKILKETKAENQSQNKQTKKNPKNSKKFRKPRVHQAVVKVVLDLKLCLFLPLLLLC